MKYTKKENWLQANWRPVAFVVYSVICIFDFVIMPSIFQIHNKTIEPATIVQLALQFKDTAAQIAFIQMYNPTSEWVPLTMQGAAAFHFAFGALLTGAAWTRGQAQIAQINQQNTPTPYKFGRNTSGANQVPDNPDARK